MAAEGHGDASGLHGGLVVPQLVDPLLLQQEGLLGGKRFVASEKPHFLERLRVSFTSLTPRLTLHPTPRTVAAREDWGQLPDAPAALSLQGAFLVLRCCLGVELSGNAHHREKHKHPFVCHRFPGLVPCCPMSSS